MVSESFRLLLKGHDTVECCYYLQPTPGCQIDYEQLAVIREGLRQSKSRDPKPITLGGVDFLLHRSGSSRGFPLVISNADCTIEFGEFNKPSFYATYRSEALWRDSAFGQHQKFMEWATTVGLEAYKPETLSRVDFAFDYVLSVIDFNEDNFVTLCAKDSRYRYEGKLQTMMFGKGDIVLRIYDKVAEIVEKSGKTWFYGLWDGVCEDVWRIEWQTRKDILRRFGIRTFADLQDQQGDLLRYLTHEHTTLRIKSEDGNRSRWLLHPLWRDLQDQIKALDSQGVYREIDRAALVNERLMRIAIAIYGYAKQVAALHCVQSDKRSISKGEAMAVLGSLVQNVHDPLSWRDGVEKRVDLIRLGQW